MSIAVIGTIVILSIIITVLILNVINRGTIGTVRAYVGRAFIVWVIVIAILASIANKLGFIKTGNNQNKEVTNEEEIEEEEITRPADLQMGIDEDHPLEEINTYDITDIIESKPRTLEELIAKLQENDIKIYYDEETGQYVSYDDALLIQVPSDKNIALLVYRENYSLYDITYGTESEEAYEILKGYGEEIEPEDAAENDKYFSINDYVVLYEEIGNKIDFVGVILDVDSVEVEIEKGSMGKIIADELKESEEKADKEVEENQIEELASKIIHDENLIDYFELSGLYSGMFGAECAISMYSDECDAEKGVIEITLNDGTFIKGGFCEEDINLYSVSTSDDRDIKIGVYSDNGNICLDIFINGEHNDYMVMYEHLVS